MSAQATRTRGIRIVATGVVGTPGARVWGIMNNGVLGSVQIRDGSGTGALLWDSAVAANQWVPLIAPVRCPGGAHVTLVTTADVTVHVDY